MVPLARRLCRRQLQGDPARPHAAGPAGRRSRSTPFPAGADRPDRELRPGAAARNSACCRRRTPPATSPRSCSACRCASRCRPTARSPACCGPACRSSVSVDTRTRSGHAGGVGAALAAAPAPRWSDAALAPAAWRPHRRPRRRARPRLHRRIPPITGRRVTRRERFGFLAMVVGMFMAILDIQIVSSSLSRDPGRAVGQRRRDQLGADLLPDRRGRDDPALGLSLAPAVDARPVRVSAVGLHR